MGLKRVQQGEPITAFWANSLVNQLDTMTTLPIAKRGGNTGTGLNQWSYPAGFQIQMSSSGAWTIEPGCIFVQGKLINGLGGSYTNNHSSLQNWASCYHHNGKQLPKWKIKGYIPSDATAEVEESKFWLINENASEEDTQQSETNTLPENPPEGYTWWEQYINEVDEEQGTIKQIISGSIYITLPVASVTARPFDVMITEVTENENNTEEETDGDEEETTEVELEVRSGMLQMPNKELIMIPQTLELKKTTEEPFFVILQVYRDAEAKVKYTYKLQNYNEHTADGWTQIDAEEERNQ